MIYRTPEDLIIYIKMQMISQNISLKELSKILNTTPSSLANTFKTKNPRLSTLYQICNALNLDINIIPRDTE